MAAERHGSGSHPIFPSPTPPSRRGEDMGVYVREVTEVLPILVSKRAITIVGEPFVMEKKSPSGMGETIQRTSVYFIVANRPDKTGEVDIEADFNHVFNVLHDEMHQPVGVSYTHHSSYEEFADNPNLRVLFPPKFYLRVHPPAFDTVEELLSTSRVKEVVELYVLPTAAAAAEMHSRFENGFRIPALIVNQDGLPVPEESQLLDK